MVKEATTSFSEKFECDNVRRGVCILSYARLSRAIKSLDLVIHTVITTNIIHQLKERGQQDEERTGMHAFSWIKFIFYIFENESK